MGGLTEKACDKIICKGGREFRETIQVGSEASDECTGALDRKDISRPAVNDAVGVSAHYNPGSQNNNQGPEEKIWASYSAPLSCLNILV